MNLLRALVSCLVLAAGCGGATSVDPIGGPATTPPTTTETPGPGTTPTTPGPGKPALPTGPYTGAVGTTDVSILYPLPLAGASKDFVAPSEVGAFGALLPKPLLESVTGGRPLESTNSSHPSGYDELRVISMRLDPCSKRGTATCRSEVRLVFQAVYEKTAGEDGDPVAGTAATDGAVHVMYDVTDAELVVILKQILTLKKANGDLALHELAPHPILATQGLSGEFAKGLRAIMLAHLGGDRIGRITVFDHNFNPDSDGWQFEIFDRDGATMKAAKIKFASTDGQMVFGSSALVPLADSNGDTFGTTTTPDPVMPLVLPSRPAPGAPGVSTLQASLDAALRIQNPSLHDAESTDCANCHLAEGAARLGSSVYKLDTSKAFTHTRSLARKDERTSVTNLHAFGYLHRTVSIMQRTANESVVVADRMEPLIK